jgi:hypothetical protein
MKNIHQILVLNFLWKELRETGANASYAIHR